MEGPRDAAQEMNVGPYVIGGATCFESEDLSCVFGFM